MWLNHFKKDTINFETKTTLFTEAMYASTKSHYEGTWSNFSLHTSANIMLDKSNRNHEETRRINSRNVESNRKFNDQYEGDYLTDHSYKLITKQMQLSKHCRVLRYSDKTFLVHTPITDENIENF